MRGYINKIKVVQRSARNAFSSGNQIISVFHSEKKINQRRRGPKSRFLSHRCLKSLAEPKTIQTVRNGKSSCDIGRLLLSFFILDEQGFCFCCCFESKGLDKQ
ncbi:hypothetical protein NC651_001687 [Populus alba x Populus x berolinensis]|nr:hypothetical protein NC651_001687 [Populus alba x Populus x berolinensis]